MEHVFQNPFFRTECVARKIELTKMGVIVYFELSLSAGCYTVLQRTPALIKQVLNRLLNMQHNLFAHTPCIGLF